MRTGAMFCCCSFRKICTQEQIRTGNQKKRSRKCIAVAGALLTGGCLYVTYEALSLRIGLTVHTNAVDSEKLKSYVYVYREPALPLARSGLTDLLKWHLQRLAHRLHEASAWLLQRPVEEVLVPTSHRELNLSPWILLKRCMSGEATQRQKAILELSAIHNWDAAQYRSVAQACDPATTIILARCKDVDRRFFLPPPWQQRDTRLDESLQAVLLNLPTGDVDPCVSRLTSLVLSDSSQTRTRSEAAHWTFVGEILPGQRPSTPVSEDQVESICVKVILQHSKLPRRCEQLVHLGVLDLLLRLIEQDGVGPQLQHNALRVVGNLAMQPHLHSTIVQSGWVRVLVERLQSGRVIDEALAARALANMDRETVREHYPDGVYLLHPQQITTLNTTGDVLFVHGLLGAAFKTWRLRDPEASVHLSGGKYRDVSQCWPKSWLGEDCPENRVLSVEYDTRLSDWFLECPADSCNVSINVYCRRSLAYRSREMLAKLQVAGVGEKPIVWVTHSLGGLMVKQMLVDAASNPAACDVLANTRAVVFFGVPHSGSRLAELSLAVRFVLFPSAEIAELRRDSAMLQELHKRFTELVRRHGIKVLSFGETQPTTLGMLRTLIVSTESADPGVGEFETVPVDHLNVCKPEGRHSPIYQRTLELICTSLAPQQATPSGGPDQL
uniref:protein SERAC1 isoform X5 n=1 Tax=Myxine glutinosa TaxID=7769 RepID=UPI00358F0A02